MGPQSCQIVQVAAGSSLFEGMSLMSGPAEPSPPGLPPKKQEAIPKSRSGRGSGADSADALEHAFTPPVLTPQANDKTSNAARYSPSCSERL